MAIQNRIRWSQKDYVTLGKAVAKFNKKINELNKEERKLYLPENIEYKEIKENIYTRNELKRVISSLKNFTKQGAEELYTTKAGEQITKWEMNELKLQSRVIKNRLRGELKNLSKVNEQGISRVQMGSERVREIEAQIRNLNKLEKKTGWEFQSLRRRIQSSGTMDYTYRKALVYQENYLKEMEKYKNFDNYELLEQKLKSLKNPISFFDLVSENELTGDLTYQSDQYYSQAEFNKFLGDLGIEIPEEESEIISDLENNE